MLRDVSNPVNTNVSFLLCSVLTLIPVDNIFKKVVIKQDLFCNRTNKTFILVGLNEKRLASLFSNILKSTPLRQTAHKIAAPILGKEFRSFNTESFNTSEVKTLQKYLKKYRSIYRRHFLKKQGSYNNYNYHTDKELNYFAIESLLLLIGV